MIFVENDIRFSDLPTFVLLNRQILKSCSLFSVREYSDTLSCVSRYYVKERLESIDTADWCWLGS